MFHPEGPSVRELVRQGLSSTRRGYDLLAPKFDLTPFRTPDPILARAVEVLRADRPRPGRVLDVCCGTGAAMIHLRPHADELVGIDFSEGMLAEGRDRLAVGAGASVRFVRGDVLEMEFESGFDLAVCFGALGHFVGKDQARFLERVHRALVPGGRFAFVTHHRPPLTSPALWVSRAFNAAMVVRNLLIRPPFIMYYLTFLLPGILDDLQAVGFRTEVRPLADEEHPLRLVIATRP